MNDHTTEITKGKEKEKKEDGTQEKEEDGTEANEESEGMLSLPNELKILFASYLEVVDILNLSKVNSHLRFLVADNQLWRHLFIRDFFHVFSKQYQEELLAARLFKGY